MSSYIYKVLWSTLLAHLLYTSPSFQITSEQEAAIHAGSSGDQQLFTQANNVQVVRSNVVLPPKMKLVSPMQRYVSRVAPKDEFGNEVDDSARY